MQSENYSLVDQEKRKELIDFLEKKGFATGYYDEDHLKELVDHHIIFSEDHVMVDITPTRFFLFILDFLKNKGYYLVAHQPAAVEVSPYMIFEKNV